VWFCFVNFVYGAVFRILRMVLFSEFCVCCCFENFAYGAVLSQGSRPETFPFIGNLDSKRASLFQHQFKRKAASVEAFSRKHCHSLLVCSKISAG